MASFFKFFTSKSPNPRIGTNPGDNAVAKLADLNFLLPLEGTSAPTGVVTPKFIGQQFVNTTTGKIYSAAGQTAADWKILN